MQSDRRERYFPLKLFHPKCYNSKNTLQSTINKVTAEMVVFPFLKFFVILFVCFIFWIFLLTTAIFCLQKIRPSRINIKINMSDEICLYLACTIIIETSPVFNQV